MQSGITRLIRSCEFHTHIEQSDTSATEQIGTRTHTESLTRTFSSHFSIVAGQGYRYFAFDSIASLFEASPPPNDLPDGCLSTRLVAAVNVTSS